MRYITVFSALFFVFFSFLFSGCGPARPSDLPPVAPCKVKVNNDGRPLPNISVSFLRTESHGGAWTINGMTGSDGVAVCQTIVGAYETKGIPIGIYRITLREQIDIPSELGSIDGITPAAQKYIEENRLLPVILTDITLTPLELSVTLSGAELDIDVSKYK